MSDREALLNAIQDIADTFTALDRVECGLILDKIEPLIRADERKRMAEDNTGDPSASWHLEYLQDGISDLRERIKAMGRMLLDSGDITPMGVRMINKIAGDGDE